MLCKKENINLNDYGNLINEYNNYSISSKIIQ